MAKDYSDINLNERLETLNSLAAKDRGYIKPLDFLSTKFSLPAGALNYTKILGSNREYKAIVSTGKSGGSFNEIKDAIDYVKKLGGGNILIKSGTHFPSAPLELEDNIYLIGEDQNNSIIDLTNAGTLTNGGVQIIGVQVSSTGTFSISQSGSTVTGSSSQFTTDAVTVGDIIIINNIPYTVATIGGETYLTIEETYRGTSVSGAT